jgi:hypothetical protein
MAQDKDWTDYKNDKKREKAYRQSQEERAQKDPMSFLHGVPLEQQQELGGRAAGADDEAIMAAANIASLNAGGPIQAQQAQKVAQAAGKEAQVRAGLGASNLDLMARIIGQQIGKVGDMTFQTGQAARDRTQQTAMAATDAAIASAGIAGKVITGG